ncbi:pyrimidine reductase family protein [Agromyces archimandritae]|uniref:Pyrimidine reductase family protein n=1 Tax=Agromyces archimandritae TaxID=2781962 RepID=A0A975FKZ0_9MICO|nr:pyrimidine reductase family protein [Agromyces archimandritae]QTX03999.1 pyrimidine reductase family protein [Agromyces archimandritae]
MSLDIAAMREAYAVADRAAPRLRANFIASLDGAATVGGRSGGIGGPDDQRLMGVLRSLADVVIVGAGTIRAEGYGALRLSDEDAEWRTDAGLAPHPPVAVVSASLDLDPAAALFAEAPVRAIVVTTERADPERRAALAEVADVFDGGADAVEATRLVGILTGLGHAQMLCEGGPHLFGTLAAADAVDELCLTLSPRLVGGAAGRILRGAPELDTRLALVHALPAGDLLFTRYARG